MGAVALALTGVALTRSQGVEAHTVTTPYPLTCSMVGLSPVFTTDHVPMDGTTAGGALTLNVHLATPASGHAMTTRSITFALPKPALIQRINGVTFKPTANANFTGAATVNQATGMTSFTFTGNAMSNAITLPDFSISAVTSTAAVAGDRVSWIGPSQVTLMDGATTVDTCTPTGGTAIQYAPTVVLASGPVCGPTTTEDPSHGDHGHGEDPACTTTTTATTATTATTSTTTTTRVTPTTPTTVVTPTTMRPPTGGLLGRLLQLLCRVFRVFC